MGTHVLQGDNEPRKVSGHHELGFALMTLSSFVPSGDQDDRYYRKHGASDEWEAVVGAVNALLVLLWEAKLEQEQAEAGSDLEAKTMKLMVFRAARAARTAARAAEQLDDGAISEEVSQ